MVRFEQAANGVLQMLSLCSVCDTHQAASVYASRKKPVKAVRDVLGYLADANYIESCRYAYDKPAAYRLTKIACKEFGLKRVSWNSQLTHKLAITDLYVALGCPRDFTREYRQEFTWGGETRFIRPDARARLPDGRYALFEVQRTPKSSSAWKQKIDAYHVYFNSEEWCSFTDIQPSLVIVSLHRQQTSTIGAAVGCEPKVLYTWEDVQSWASGCQSVSPSENLWRNPVSSTQT